MILFIISSTLIVVGVVAFILTKKIDGDDFLLKLGFGAIFFGVLSLLPIGLNYLIDNRTRFLKEKEKIEEILEYDTSYCVIEKAQSYNKSVNYLNNYFFRFTIEDRNDLLIDIERYLENGI